VGGSGGALLLATPVNDRAGQRQPAKNRGASGRLGDGGGGVGQGKIINGQTMITPRVIDVAKADGQILAAGKGDTARLADKEARFALALPSRAPAVPPVMGLVNVNAASWFHPTSLPAEKFVMGEEPILYQTVTSWAAALFCHCSPM
jgi:hypothetical protein